MLEHEVQRTGRVRSFNNGSNAPAPPDSRSTCHSPIVIPVSSSRPHAPIIRFMVKVCDSDFVIRFKRGRKALVST